MGFGEAISSCLSKFFTFAGRAPRSEYWYFYLFCLLCTGVGAGLDVVLGTATYDENGAFEAGVLMVLFMLMFIVPYFSVAVRRLHDIDRSGWWLWVGLIPLLGTLILLVWNCMRGTEGNNRYGPNPLNPVPVGVFD